MLKSLLALVVLVASWIMALWFVLPVNLNALPYPRLILLHVVPPALLFVLWLIRRVWQRRRQSRADARQLADEEAQRQAAKTAAQQQRQAELRQRRFGCDCRAAVVTGTNIPTSILMCARSADDAGEETDDDDFLDVEDERSEPKLSSELEEFADPLRQALAVIYRETPAALALPVYVVPPTHLAATEVIALIRRFRQEIGGDLDPDFQPEFDPDAIPVKFAPSGNGVADSAIAVFEHLPDLPGAILVALDAPIQRDRMAYAKATASEQRAAVTAELDECARWCGQSGLAVVTLLLTHPEIATMLASIRAYSPDDEIADDAMKPFWQRSLLPPEQLAQLARMAPSTREQLAGRAVLARIHRTAFSQCEPRVGSTDLGLLAQSLMEKAFVASGLIEPAGCTNAASAVTETVVEEPAVKVTENPAELGWLVHNAGTVDRYAARLGAMASSLRYFGHDLHPLDDATNFAVVVGGFGAATAWAMLAEAVMRTAESGTATLLVDFRTDNDLALSVTTPP